VLGLDSCLLVFFLQLFQRRTSAVMWHKLLYRLAVDVFPDMPINSVKAMKETQKTLNATSCLLSFFLHLPMDSFLMEETLLSLRQFSSYFMQITN